MQSHPGMHEAPVVHVAGSHCPMGSAQEHTSPALQSESFRQPWTHVHDAGMPPSGDTSSQYPSGSDAQSESEWQVAGGHERGVGLLARAATVAREERGTRHLRAPPGVSAGARVVARVDAADDDGHRVLARVLAPGRAARGAATRGASARRASARRASTRRTSGAVARRGVGMLPRVLGHASAAAQEPEGGHQGEANGVDSVVSAHRGHGPSNARTSESPAIEAGACARVCP